MFASVQEAEHWDYEGTRAHTLADEHNDWHAAFGWNAGCPLDCEGADLGHEDIAEVMDLATEIAWDLAQRGISCGHCHGRHPSVAWVFACYVQERGTR